MNVIIILALLMLAALIIVSFIHEKQKKEQIQRQQQRRLRLQIEELNEVLGCIEQTVGDKHLARKINGLIYGLLEALGRLDAKRSPYVETALHRVMAHNQELDSSHTQLPVRYERESDAQINKTQRQLIEAINILSNLASQGRLEEAEFESYQNELRWAHLMVAVMSYIAQGKKSLTIGDRVTAQAFFQRAHFQLMESTHPNSKRLNLIKEINEMIDGDRSQLSSHLVGLNHGLLNEEIDF